MIAWTRAIQSHVILIASLLAEERTRLHTVRKHWGAGFELIYFDGNQFKKPDEITYVINEAEFGKDGKVANIPVPSVVLHCKFVADLLLITAIAPFSGETEQTETEIIIRYKAFKARMFIV